MPVTNSRSVMALVSAPGLVPGREISARDQLEQSIERALDPAGKGAHVYVRRFDETARSEADSIDSKVRAGLSVGALAGIPVSVKDLFDVKGQVTTAGSVILADSAPASADSAIVSRLRRAGAVITGHTTMTEFAFSGLGINPHYGTPANPYSANEPLLPGGSSSGAAVSITAGMARIAIGSDTGGSVRIPAALCGLVGFKASAGRISRSGMLPLSTTLDSIGPIAETVELARAAFEVISDQPGCPPVRRDLARARALVPTNVILDDSDVLVQNAFERTLARLSDAGVEIVFEKVDLFQEIVAATPIATFPAIEGYAWHREYLEAHEARYDPLVASRLKRGKTITSSDHIWLIRLRERLIRQVGYLMAGFDFLLMPTVPTVAPSIRSLIDDHELYFAMNGRMLRNPSLVNFLDGCAISLPCQTAGDLPVGISVCGFELDDETLLDWAAAAEAILTPVAD